MKRLGAAGATTAPASRHGPAQPSEQSRLERAEGAALVAVAVTGTEPQLGTVYDDSGHALVIDTSDIFRDAVFRPVAIAAVRRSRVDPGQPVEEHARALAAKRIPRKQVVPSMNTRLGGFLATCM